MRLIDADSISLKGIPMDMGGLVYIEDVLLKIEELPTVDTAPTESEFKRIAIQRGYVPVVRCGECEFARKVDNREPMYKCVNICRYGCTQWVGSDDFCSYGERR